MMNRRDFMKTAGAAVLAAGSTAFAGVRRPSTRSKKPNFVMIFIDDMGYGDIGPFGSKVNKTRRRARR